MTTLSVFEHQWLPIGEGAGAVLSERQAAALERLEASLPAGTLGWRRHEVKFTQYCGVLQLGGQTIEVLPKIARHDEDVVRSRSVLIKMLASAGVFSVVPVGESMVSVQRTNLLDVFIDHFRASVEAQARHGLIRRYIDREESLPRVKGRIDMARQLRDNLTRPHMTTCRFDELERDNLFNQSLLYVLDLLASRTANPAIRQRVYELMFHFGDVARIAITPSEIRSLQFTRNDDRWRPIFDQAALILEGLFPDVMAGQTPALALLFDMNRLFERFVASRLRKGERHYSIREQGPQRHLAVNGNEKNVFLLKPDIVMLQDGRVSIIADAKWKLLDRGHRSWKVSQSDLYQMLAYSHRYGCSEVVIMHPYAYARDEVEVLERFKLLNSTVTVSLCGIRVGDERKAFGISHLLGNRAEA